MDRTKTIDVFVPLGAKEIDVPTWVQANFAAVRDPGINNIALMAVTVNGDPAAAVVAINKLSTGELVVTPLFVSVTDAMDVRDAHDGEPARARNPEGN